MKLVERDIWKIVPGKMAEAMELEKREAAALKRLGVDIPIKHYLPTAGTLDQKHTIVAESELGSFASIATLGEKIGVDPEMEEIRAKWEEISESQVTEFYMVED